MKSKDEIDIESFYEGMKFALRQVKERFKKYDLWEERFKPELDEIWDEGIGGEDGD